MTRVLVVDDHAIVRMGVVALLETQPDLTCVGEAEDGAEAIRLARRLKPDVVLMDIMMPGVDGIAATRDILAQDPKIKVLILTTSSSPDELARALEAGAVGAILKSEANKSLLATIRSIARGEIAVSREVASRIEQGSADERLSPRQFEILRSLARGLTNQEIARELGIGAESVKDHVNHLCLKLGAANRTEAVALAYRKHLLPTN